MLAVETSLVVKVLIVAAAALAVFAWWLSEQTAKRTRALITYLKSNQGPYWHSLPWHARNLNPVAAIEAYRRSPNAADPEFHALYEARKSSNRMLFFAIVIAMAPIGIVLIGTAFFGWNW